MTKLLPNPTPAPPTLTEAELAEILDSPEWYDNHWMAALAGRNTAEKIAQSAGLVWLVDHGLASEWTPPARVKSPEAGGAKPVSLKMVGGQAVAPPAVNHAAEANLLAAFFLYKELRVDLIAEVEPSCFADPSRAVLWEIMGDLHLAGHDFDAAILLDALSREGSLARAGGAEAVHRLDTPKITPDMGRRYALIVREDSDRREAYDALNSLVKNHSRASRPQELASHIRGLLDRLDPQTQTDPEEGTAHSWPSAPGEAFWSGLAGEIVSFVEPETEADPIAILMQLLVSFGNMIGRNAHWSIDATRHYCNLNLAIVGPTSNGRKGTAMDIVELLTSGLDDDWINGCIKGGMTSGEGFLEAMKDDAVDNDGKVICGVKDKRTLWIEREFGSTLALMARDGNSLSGFLRHAWDGKNLYSNPKKDPIKVSEPHASIIGHATFGELCNNLKDSDRSNGLANRFLWACVRQSKHLPEGGGLLSMEFAPYKLKLARALKFAKKPSHKITPIPFDSKARELWHAAYPHLMRPRVGKAADILARGAPQVRRIAVIYAVLDRSASVAVQHLQAALEFWGYCERSVTRIFGAGATDKFQEKVLESIIKGGEGGLTHYEVNRLLCGGRKKDEVSSALERLVSDGLVEVKPTKKGGRTIACYASAGFSGLRVLRATSVRTTQVPTPK